MEPLITALGKSEHMRELVNQQLEPLNWQITCIHFTPNAPKQNPVENMWLQAKRFIREFYHLCKSFFAVKRLFELVTHIKFLIFPKYLCMVHFHN